MSYLPHFRYAKNFPKKSLAVTFTHSLMPFVRYNFTKITDIVKSSKTLILGPKMPHISHFWHKGNLP